MAGSREERGSVGVWACGGAGTPARGAKGGAVEVRDDCGAAPHTPILPCPHTPILEARGATRIFGGLTAVDSVSFGVSAGQLKSLIGPNGAGKSTLLNLLSGVLKLSAGEIVFRGTPMSGLQAHEAAGLGIARTFQNVQLFENMSVLENVMVGRHARTRQGLLAAALRLPGQLREERKIVSYAMEKLELVGLAGRAGDPGSALPFGQQRLLEIARALASEPKLLLLDEPASGLSSQETEDLAELLRRIVAEGVTVLLVDHDMQFIMDISDEVLVLDHGQKIAEGTPAQVQDDPRVIAAYLGMDASSASRGDASNASRSDASNASRREV